MHDPEKWDIRFSEKIMHKKGLNRARVN